MRPKILSVGVGSEHVLEPLERLLRDEGFEVIDIDFLNAGPNEVAQIDSLRDERTVFMSSGHVNLTKTVAQTLAPTLSKNTPLYMAPLDIISRLRPLASMVFPHDFVTSFYHEGLREERFLSLFSHVFTIYEDQALRHTLGQNTSVIPAGWIKFEKADLLYASKPQDEIAPRNATVLVSELSHLVSIFKPEELVSYFSPLLRQGFRIKLPAWFDVQQIEDAIQREFPESVIPSTVKSTVAILESQIVIGNSGSSINAEAIALGVPVITLDDPEIGLPARVQKLQRLGVELFHDYSKQEPIGEDLLNAALEKRPERSLEPFNFKAVMNVFEGLI